MRAIVILGMATGMLAAAIAGPATAQPQTSTQQPVTQQQSATQPPSAVADNDPIECYYQYHEGMVIRRPSCQRHSVWVRGRLEQQRALNDMERASLRNNIR